MALPEPPTYSVRTIERMAHEFLRERYGTDIPIRIDIDYLVETLPDVTLDYWPALRANHRIDGMIMRDVGSGRLFVYIDEHVADTQPNRYRMTVAEELAHLILHGKLIEQITSIDEFKALQGHYRAKEMERNAKRFAAAVLMPADNVLKHATVFYPKLVRVAGYGNTAAIMKQLVVMLAREFGVSPRAMEIRVTEWPARLNEKVKQAIADRLDFLG